MAIDRLPSPGAGIPTSTVTAKGDLIVGTANNAVSRLGVGANGTTLVADSAEATGLKWATPATGGANWSLLNAGGTALTGASTITVSGISSADKIMFLFQAASSASAGSEISMRLNGDTGNNYTRLGQYNQIATTYTVGNFTADTGVGGDNRHFLGTMSTNSGSACSGYALITGANSSGVKVIQSVGAIGPSGGNNQVFTSFGGFYNSSSTISSISLVSSTGNFDNGTIFVYTSA